MHLGWEAVAVQMLPARGGSIPDGSLGEGME